MQTKQVPKTIQRWIDENPSKVETYFVERTGPRQYALMLDLETGLKTTDHCHHIYAPDVKTFMHDAANIEPCLCEDCVAGIDDAWEWTAVGRAAAPL